MAESNIITRIKTGRGSLKIRSKGDFRVVLDVISALNDDELPEADRLYAALFIFYTRRPEKIKDLEGAVTGMLEFISGGLLAGDGLIELETDLSYIISGVNKVLGREVRAGYLSWQSFVSAFNEIGEGPLLLIAQARAAIMRGQRLTPAQKTLVGKNPRLFDSF